MSVPKKVKARKDYPHFGIRKGDEHWTWDNYGQPTMRSLTYPRPSQLTTSRWKAVLETRETIADISLDANITPEDAGSAIEDAVDALEDVQGEYDDVTEGPMVEASEECSSTIGDIIDGLQSIRDQLEELEESEEGSEEVSEEVRVKAQQERVHELLQEALALDWERPEV